MNNHNYSEVKLTQNQVNHLYSQSCKIYKLDASSLISHHQNLLSRFTRQYIALSNPKTFAEQQDLMLRIIQSGYEAFHACRDLGARKDRAIFLERAILIQYNLLKSVNG
jgi:hypothetical protein